MWLQVVRLLGLADVINPFSVVLDCWSSFPPSLVGLFQAMGSRPETDL